jgi:branched-chain amino acid aminotransferase
MLELVTETRVDLSVSGVRFGAGAFETVRIQEGGARWLDLHLERLAGACAFLGLEAPPAPEAVAAAQVLPPQGILRLLAVDRHLHMWSGPAAEAPSRDLRLGLSHETVRHPGPLTRYKTTSYLENLLLQREAGRRGLEEVLAPTAQGRLSDGGRSTLLVLAGGRLLTPPVEDGALPGIGRRLLLEAGVAAEASMVWEDLARAEAVALVSALRGVRGVACVEGLAALDPCHPGLEAARRILA